MIPKQCKRLAEVDFPIAAVSAHSAREKSIRHGHPSTLHLWWARRPLASCRSMLMALLLPDPCDSHCPEDFKTKARQILSAFPGRPQRWETELKTDAGLRHAILHEFIADFANWDNAANPAYLKTARELVKAAHGDEAPLVVDPFAGGGSIPLEALRIGCDAFASDLNPVACLINKVLLEDIPRHGPRLADALRSAGAEIKKEAEKELAAFYPIDPDGARPIAYLWARTVHCEQPNCGCEIPLMRSLWLCTKSSRRRALRYTVVRDDQNKPRVEFSIFEPTSDKDIQPGTVARAKASCPACGGVLAPERVRAQLRSRRGGAADARLLAVVTTRPGESGRFYRLPTDADLAAVAAAEDALKQRVAEYPKDGLSLIPDEALDVPKDRLVSTVGFRVHLYGMSHFADLFTPRQLLALTTLARLVRTWKPAARVADDVAAESRRFTAQPRVCEAKEDILGAKVNPAETKVFPAETKVYPAETKVYPAETKVYPAETKVYPAETKVVSSETKVYPAETKVVSSETKAISSETKSPASTPLSCAAGDSQPDNAEFDDAVRTTLALVLGRATDQTSSLVRWRTGVEAVAGTFGRNALPIMWDFVEIVPTGDHGSNFAAALEWVAEVVDESGAFDRFGEVKCASATSHPLPSDALSIFFTDPPYYDAIPYADLSDFFYVWLRRSLPESRRAMFADTLAPKRDECIVDEVKGKDRAYFERTMGQAMAEGRRVLRDDGVGAVVFAHKSTEGWEALLGGMIAAGWTISGSWPISTERPGRLRAQESAALSASIHLVCRPRDENADVGDWGGIVRELPRRIEDWMDRLGSEGIRGADLVFACIGPALELFSRYARVETPDGEQVGLAANEAAHGEPARRGFLSYVWEVAGRTALNQVLGSAESTARNGAAGALEEDARLTALFLWTLQSTDAAANGKKAKKTDAGDEEIDADENGGDEEETEAGGKSKKKPGLSLIYDVARRFAQPLGIHLDVWEGRIIETSKGIVRLLPVHERAKQLFGEDGAAGLVRKYEAAGKADPQLLLDFIGEQSAAVPEIKARRGRKKTGEPSAETMRTRKEATTLDRVHAAMLLQSSGASNALRALLHAEVQRGPDFLRLANALSALYPRDSEEKRLLDAMLLAVPR